MINLSIHPSFTHIQFSRNKGNSIDSSFIQKFSEALDQLNSSTSVLLIEGTPHFSVGMNLEYLSAMTSSQVTDLFIQYEALLQKLEQSPYITIAKMSGYAMGAGAELALSCDFRWMELKARIGFPGVNVGFTYNTKRLQQLISKQTAKRLVLTGATINAQQALSLGIADGIYSYLNKDKELGDFIDTFKNKSPIALKYAKAAFENMNADDALFESIQAGHYKEGATAFVERRKPSWG